MVILYHIDSALAMTEIKKHALHLVKRVLYRDSPYITKLTTKKRTLQARKVRKYAGAPEGTRTPDLLVRSQSLYPAELLAHSTLILYHMQSPLSMS